jgi:hypothetical protein
MGKSRLRDFGGLVSSDDNMRETPNQKVSGEWLEVAAEAGLAPGADEQIEANLRKQFANAPTAPIRYVTHLPPESVLDLYLLLTTHQMASSSSSSTPKRS